MKDFQIAPNNIMCLYGFKIPESAIYGKLAPDTIYICTDVSIHGKGKSQYFMVYIHVRKSQDSVWENSGQREAQRYYYDEWKRARVSLASDIGKKIFRYSLTNPLIIPRGEYQDKSTRKIGFRDKRPQYNHTICKVSDGKLSGKVLSDVKPKEIYYPSGYHRASIRYSNIKGAVL